MTAAGKRTGCFLNPASNRRLDKKAKINQRVIDFNACDGYTSDTGRMNRKE
jgi:hypothetical protein